MTCPSRQAILDVTLVVIFRIQRWQQLPARRHSSHLRADAVQLGVAQMSAGR
jgi:hypothetical protein